MNAAEIFSSTIDLLYSTGESTSGKPRVLWNCFFTLPDLSNVNRASLGPEFGLDEECVTVVPGHDSSMFIDRVVSEVGRIIFCTFPVFLRYFFANVGIGYLLQRLLATAAQKND